jgi:hypothetical protein
MRVKAKQNIVYKDKMFNQGEEFELENEDYATYKNAVVVIKNSNPSPKVKKTKSLEVTHTK